ISGSLSTDPVQPNSALARTQSRYNNQTLTGKMTQDRWNSIEQIYGSARSLPAAQRARYVTGACGGDFELRREVEGLLEADELAGSFLESGKLETQLRELAAEHRLPVAGSLFGHYRIQSRIGAGAMGEVFLAHDTTLDRRVALKILPPRF